MSIEQILGFINSILRVATPIIFASMGALISQKAGLTNMALEGTMLTAALAGVLASAWSQSLLIGLLAGLACGMLISLFIAYMAMKLKANLSLTCIATNLIASGMTVVFLFMATGDKGTSINVKSLVFPKTDFAFLRGIPFIGPILAEQNIMTYFAFLSVFAVWFLIYRTPIGLRIRSVGENAHAAESVGINVERMQILAFVLSGFLAALGGLFMSMGFVTMFQRDMIAGRGFIGLSAMNLGNATPLGALIASLIFGVAEVSSYAMQAMKVPAEFVQMTPYLATILGLIFFAQLRQIKKNKKKA